MPTQLQPSTSPYLQQRDDAARVGRRRTAEQAILEQQRADVEEVIVQAEKAAPFEEQLASYEEPNSDFPEQVSMAKTARRVFWIFVISFGLAFLIDFFIGTPDAAEVLGNKAMSMFPEESPAWLHTSARVIAGLLICCGVLLVTLLVKFLANTARNKQSLQQLEPGQDSAFDSIRKTILAKNALKTTYMVLLAALFTFFYQFDSARGEHAEKQDRLEEADRALETQALDLSGLFADPAVAQTTQKATPVAEQSPRIIPVLAVPAAITYVIMWCLHGLIVLLPSINAGEAKHLHSFSIPKYERRISKINTKRDNILRRLWARIDDAEDPAFKQRLVDAAAPVAARLNDANGRELLATNTPTTAVQDTQAPPADHPSESFPAPTPPPMDPEEIIFGRA